jgi:hypothetical protein
LAKVNPGCGAQTACSGRLLVHTKGMKTLSVNVPDALLLQTGGDDLARQSQFFLALKFFELGRLTSSQAAEMCAMNRVDFLVAASREGTPVADLNKEELSREIEDARS